MAAIQRRGKSYRAQVRRQGLPSLAKSFSSRSEAQTWARQMEGRLAADDWVDTREAKRTTLGEALERYLSEVTPTKNALQIISQVYVVASTEWAIDGVRNPVRGVRMPRANTGRDRRLEGDEEERLLAGCEECGCPWLRPLVVMALETGMRQGELLALRRENTRGNVVCLPNTKNGKPRSVPLSTRALAGLSSLPVALQGAVFPIGVDSLEWYWRKACRLAEVEGLRFHDLRHEATSRLFERGLDMMEVASITGHRTLVMLQRYTHLRAARLAEKLG